MNQITAPCQNDRELFLFFISASRYDYHKKIIPEENFMIIEIALNNSYGSIVLTPPMHEILKKTGGNVKGRIQLARYLKENAIQLTDENTDDLLCQKSSSIYHINHESYFIYDTNTQSVKNIIVKQVDTSKQWGITEWRRKHYILRFRNCR